MKQYNTFFVKQFLFYFFLTLFYSCQAPENYVEKHVHSNKTEIVTIDKVPAIIPSIQNFNKNYRYLSRSNSTNNTESIADLNLDLENILVYTRISNGYTSYSIPIINSISNNEAYYFENLHVIGDNEESFIYRWTPQDETVPFDLKTFTGKLEKFDTDYIFKFYDNYLNGQKQPRTTQFGKIFKSDNPVTDDYAISCESYTYCGCNGVPYFCNCNECKFVTWYSCESSGGGGSGGEGGSGGGGTGTGSGGTGNTGGTGTIPTTTYGETVPVIPYRNINLVTILSLNTTQATWINSLTNSAVKRALQEYMYYNPANVSFGVDVFNLSKDLEINAMDVWKDYELFRAQMSNDERNVFDNMLINRRLMYIVAAKKAIDETEERYPTTAKNGTGDAFRHALWNGMSSLLIGENLTEQLTTAHETRPSDYTYTFNEKDMDLYNNLRGRQIANYSNVFTITDNVVNYLQIGGLRFLNNLDNNSLATYNSILVPTN